MQYSGGQNKVRLGDQGSLDDPLHLPGRRRGRAARARPQGIQPHAHSSPRCSRLRGRNDTRGLLRAGCFGAHLGLDVRTCATQHAAHAGERAAAGRDAPAGGRGGTGCGSQPQLLCALGAGSSRAGRSPPRRTAQQGEAQCMRSPVQPAAQHEDADGHGKSNRGDQEAGKPRDLHAAPARHGCLRMPPLASVATSPGGAPSSSAKQGRTHGGGGMQGRKVAMPALVCKDALTLVCTFTTTVADRMAPTLMAA